ncbi:hypothetical protein KFL_000980200 [Klebsormidium nitens]|uniref:Uncharacterized protein n=1 Tax=Klebsormidium nitens TaxID=105231 RepID=A0A0U9HNE9_KLENI|nr:hypothetical protein KFL_000980200 [Klebsormidium nitens]|eukprot:GAQ82033.1 hypothetical protein KFL_000980200 [Klebsormidium nitens]
MSCLKAAASYNQRNWQLEDWHTPLLRGRGRRQGDARSNRLRSSGCCRSGSYSKLRLTTAAREKSSKGYKTVDVLPDWL